MARYELLLVVLWAGGCAAVEEKEEEAEEALLPVLGSRPSLLRPASEVWLLLLLLLVLVGVASVEWISIALPWPICTCI